MITPRVRLSYLMALHRATDTYLVLPKHDLVDPKRERGIVCTPRLYAHTQTSPSILSERVIRYPPVMRDFSAI